MFKAFLFSLMVAGCTGTGAVQYSASAEVATPTLVEVEPGVQVVADYDEPVFYTDGFYWRYDAGAWYRSPYYNRAWVSVSAPPVAVRQIQRPEIYAHYHANAQVRNREARVTPQPTPEIRDHRTEPTRVEVRDHRDDSQERRDENRHEQMERHDDRQEQERRDDHAKAQIERRDDKAERRDEKRDDKAERRDEKRDDKAERRDDKRDKRHH